MLSAAQAIENGMDLVKYQRMLDAVAQTAPPYPAERFSGRGIVLCGGGETYFPCAWVCIQMLRRSGCSLPIELWYRGPAEMTSQMISLLEPMGVSCVDAYLVARQHPVRRLDGWELKPYAIVNSRFEEVLYLDADNIALRNPEFLFSSTGYADTGAVFWPDRYTGPGSGQEWLKREAWAVCRVPYRVEPEIEAGQLLIDKRRCWHPLNVALHLNEHSDFYYAFFLGDKDTFHLAWHRCGCPYCLVPIVSRTLGHSEAIVQHDFEGNPLFQHRNGAKWTISRRNNRIPGFAQEEECLSCLDVLASIWNPPVRRLPEQFTAAERRAYLEICAARFFQYRLEGADLRTLELCPDFQIGSGAAEMESAWMIEEDKDGAILLSIRNAHAPTCFLRKEPDGVWRGRWLVYDRLRVQLAARDTSPAALCGPALASRNLA